MCYQNSSNRNFTKFFSAFVKSFTFNEQTRFRAHIAQKRLQEAKAAATKIQATFRGYKTRKFLHDQKEMENMENLPFLLVSDIVNDIVTQSTADDEVCKETED